MAEDSQSTEGEAFAPEVEEIVSRSPSKYSAWTLSLTFLTFVAFLFGSSFIEYPDVLVAEAVITSQPKPVEIVSLVAGKIHLLKADNEPVRMGDVVGYIETGSKFESLIQLKELLSNFEKSQDIQMLYDSLKKVRLLPDFREDINNIIRDVESLLYIINSPVVESEIRQLEERIKMMQSLKKDLLGRINFQKKERRIHDSIYNGSSDLINVQTRDTEYNQARNNTLQMDQSLITLESNFLTYEIQIMGFEQQIIKIKSDRAYEATKIKSDILLSVLLLKAKIANWEGRHSLISPIEGRVTYLEFIENEQYIQPQKLFTVLPSEYTIMAYGTLPVEGTGKIQKGQEVDIELENYPKNQFGVLGGTVLNVSILPNFENKYRVTIKLNNGMISSYNKRIPFQPILHGEMKIKTEKHTILQRVFSRIKILNAIQPLGY